MQKRIRYLRQKHSISIQELARHSDVSAQRLSQIELNDTNTTVHMNRIMEQAMHRYLQQRREELRCMEADFQKYRKYLLDPVDERGEPL